MRFEHSRSTVVLPHPDGPMNAVISFSYYSDTSVTARNEP